MKVLRTAVGYGFVPLMLLGFGGTGIAWAGAGATPAALLGLLAVAIATAFSAERIAPYEDVWNRSHTDAGRDLAHLVVNEASHLAGLALLPAAATHMTLFELWPVSLPFVAQVLIAVVVLDFGITLAHFASHRIGLLWRFHAVHHSVRRMYGMNGLMKHPVHQAIETAAGTTPLLLVGLPYDVAVAMVFCVGIQLLVQHANVDLHTGPLRYVLATAEVHRYHHRADPVRGDVNFGLFLCIWDMALGTFCRERVRVTPGSLGVHQRPEYPSAYLPQLIEPFRGA